MRFDYPDYGRDWFLRDFAANELTILREDGLYRHLRFQRPGSSLYWFDLVTWPGALTVTGDVDTFTFKCERDMIAFFRGQPVNPSYWAEKITDGRERARSYSEDTLKRMIAKALVEYAPIYPDALAQYQADQRRFDETPETERYPYTLRGPRRPQKPPTVAQLREEYADAARDGLLGDESFARQLLARWDGYGVTGDSWETELRTFDVHYLRACHAIAWGIEQYDKAKSAEQAPKEFANV
jgi:hypothetical protein